MSEITDEQKAEIKRFIQASADQFTDTVSVIWEALGLSDPPKEQKTSKPLRLKARNIPLAKLRKLLGRDKIDE